MGTYTPQQFVGKLAELNVAIGGVPRRGAETASLVVERSVMSRTPGRLRGVRNRGGKLGVRHVIQDGGETVTSVIRPTGPFHLIERDTTAHQIPTESGSGQVHFAVFGGNVYARVDHPGTKGKHPFEKGSIAARPAVTKIFEQETDVAVRGVFL